MGPLINPHVTLLDLRDALVLCHDFVSCRMSLGPQTAIYVTLSNVRVKSPKTFKAYIPPGVAGSTQTQQK